MVEKMHKLMVRVSNEQNDQLTARAAASGVSKATLVRQAVDTLLHNNGPVGPTRQQLVLQSKRDAEKRRNLAGAFSNLNQVAKQLNTAAKIGQDIDNNMLAAVLDIIDDAQNTIKDVAKQDKGV